MMLSDTTYIITTQPSPFPVGYVIELHGGCCLNEDGSVSTPDGMLKPGQFRFLTQKEIQEHEQFNPFQ